jgi:polyvinyl alcohol dehydrogenase (cytochrome)
MLVNVMNQRSAPGRAGFDTRPLLTVMVACTALALAATPCAVAAQSADGADVFARACASCHDGAPASRAPSLDALRTRTPQAITDALLTGSMRMQGARLSGAERRAVSEYTSGRPVTVPDVNAATGRCASPTAFQPSASAHAWNGWSPTEGNTHAQTADAAGMTAADVPRLKLKWALGFPDASVAFSQPTVVGDRVFVGSHSGAVYSLHARSGCIYWTFAAKAAVRTAVVVAAVTGGQGGYAAYFGDLAGNMYAVSADRGTLIWVRQIDAHPFARITGSPALHGNRLYVPVSSLEESMASNPDYGCCTFRGSLVALDAGSGDTIWQAFTIATPPTPRGRNAAGHVLNGPSGVPIWTTPTIDIGRRRIYVSTGNMYSGPQQPTSDAVLALNLDDGRVVWTRQMTPNDVFPCPAASTNCLESQNGPDFDFGNAPMLTASTTNQLIVIGQKSGIGWALDPDRNGAIVWQYRAGQGGTLGGMEWGSSVDDERAYFPVSDIQREQAGGLHAVSLKTGERIWHAAPRPPLCGSVRNCNAAQAAAITVIPGVVFSGANDGGLRAYSTKDGSVLWEFDTNRAFQTVNGVPARGASINGPGPTVVDGMLYTNSGYGQYGGRAGNVLLAFGID